MNIICKIVHGSRLYKLDGPNSDFDIKGLFLPDINDCVLNRAVKNTQEKKPEEKTEIEMFSLQEFLKHASRAEGYAIDLLHHNDEDIIIDCLLWDFLRENKHMFYTKNMVGSVGFAKSQAVKYALKAERLNDVKKVVEFLKKSEEKGVFKMFQIWDDLPEGQHIKKGEDEANRNADKRYIEIAGKKLPATIAITYGREILENLISSFGQRVKEASQMDEKDVKSLSHSFRVGYQLLNLYKFGTFSYPLPETNFIKAVKYRQLDYTMDELDNKLNELITWVEELATKSTFPEKVNQKWLDDIILQQYNLA